MNQRYPILSHLSVLLLVANASSSVCYTQAQANTPAIQRPLSHHQTYIIDTYGGDRLLAAVRQQLVDIEGSSASVYQDKIILRTTPNGYAAVQSLISQIDTAPVPVKLSVRVGSIGNRDSSSSQGQVIISNDSYPSQRSNNYRRSNASNRHHINAQGYANINNRTSAQTKDSLYQVNTLSGSKTIIGTSNILSLVQPLIATTYNQNGTPTGFIQMNGQILAEANQGIAVIPKLLPNNQVQVSIYQVEDSLTDNANTPISSQTLATTLTMPRGQWTSIGQISQVEQRQSNTSYRNTSTQYPIDIKID